VPGGKERSESRGDLMSREKLDLEMAR